MEARTTRRIIQTGPTEGDKQRTAQLIEAAGKRLTLAPMKTSKRTPREVSAGHVTATTHQGRGRRPIRLLHSFLRFSLQQDGIYMVEGKEMAKTAAFATARVGHKIALVTPGPIPDLRIAPHHVNATLISELQIDKGGQRSRHQEEQLPKRQRKETPATVQWPAPATAHAGPNEQLQAQVRLPCVGWKKCSKSLPKPCP